MGIFLILFCALSFALHILFVDKYVKINDSILLAIIQIGVVALLSGVLAGVGGEVIILKSFSVWTNIIYMGLFATAIALLIQNKAQERTTPTKSCYHLLSRACLWEYILLYDFRRVDIIKGLPWRWADSLRYGLGPD